MQNVNYLNTTCRYAVNHNVVGVHHSFSGTHNATWAIQVGMLGKRLSGFFNGLIKRFGSKGVTLAEIVEYRPQRFAGLGAPLN